MDIFGVNTCFVNQVNKVRLCVSLMFTDNTHTHRTLMGLKVELQISLLGGADGPLMFLAHITLSSSLQIVPVENLLGRRTSD